MELGSKDTELQDGLASLVGIIRPLQDMDGHLQILAKDEGRAHAERKLV